MPSTSKLKRTNTTCSLLSSLKDKCLNTSAVLVAQIRSSGGLEVTQDQTAKIRAGWSDHRAVVLACFAALGHVVVANLTFVLRSPLTRVQERTERGFLNMLLACSVIHRLSLPDSSASTYS